MSRVTRRFGPNFKEGEREVLREDAKTQKETGPNGQMLPSRSDPWEGKLLLEDYLVALLSFFVRRALRLAAAFL